MGHWTYNNPWPAVLPPALHSRYTEPYQRRSNNNDVHHNLPNEHCKAKGHEIQASEALQGQVQGGGGF